MKNRFPEKLIRVLVLALAAAACGGRKPAVTISPEYHEAQRLIHDASVRAERESLTWDVTKRGLRGREWLAADAEGRLRLEQLAGVDASAPGFDAAARETLEVLLARARRNIVCGAGGLEEAPEVSVALDVLAEAERAGLEEALSEPGGASRWAVEAVRGLPASEPHPGAALRALSAAPLWPFVRGWMAWHAAHEWRGANWRDFPQTRRYEPDRGGDVAVRGRLALASNEELLSFYAPVVVQEIPIEPPPDFRDDLIGAAELFPGRDGRPASHIDTTRPTIYGRVTRACLRGEWLRQVNYTLWYPEHPALKRRDPEAGAIEGEVVRITLDARNEPILAEAVYACGCYHRIYPLDAVEAAARAQFGEPVSGEHALARRFGRRIDPVIPETAGVFDAARPHPLVFVRSGFHLVAAVRFGDAPPPARERIGYELAAEESLELLPWGSRAASFFGRDSLVRGADRPEAALLYPSGLYHAGTPRIAPARRIHFDQYDYNDPGLLGVMLRIPDLNGAKR